jgi:hypothetical protein
LAAYARQAKNKEMEADAIRIRARRRLDPMRNGLRWRRRHLYATADAHEQAYRAFGALGRKHLEGAQNVRVEYYWFSDLDIVAVCLEFGTPCTHQ